MTSSAELRLVTAPQDASQAFAQTEATVFEANSAEDVRAEVRRIVGSVQFDASERNRRFLEYVVEETLAGNAHRIKAYTIATTVFGRDVHFDPQQDPVVRMEARRLRRSLERFYLTEGKHGAVRITMPKGGYVPEFCDEPEHAAPQSGFDAESHSGYVSSILVKPFELEGDQSIFLSYEQGLTRELMIGLSRYPHLRVYGSRSHGRASAHDEELMHIERTADFVLSGSKAVLADKLHVKAVLHEATTGRVLWGQRFQRDLPPQGTLGVRDEVANAIARTVAEPFGVIFNHKARRSAGQDDRAPGVSECMLLFHQYRRAYRRDLYRPAREGLERAVLIDPDCAEAFARLSQLHTDGHRFGFAVGDSPAMLLGQAVALAQKAIEIAPDSSSGYHALGMACWFQQDVGASLKASETALALNTNAVEVIAELGLYWSLLAEWERALPLLESASAMEAGHVTGHHVGLCLYHFIGGRFEQALAAARDIHALDVTHGHALQAISLLRLGRREEAAAAVRSVLAIDPHYGHDVLADVGGGNVHPDLGAHIEEALADAGLSAAASRG
ncbi:tetratricopeptide repeat protein [Arvimicrobium flavum]|uniref:tetratricopeptide repeat protein n=1 Tax=Arvimicrobium flavum TaxID=3393320 RepID=UPI00237BA04C|nr:hypothetical protein [Mesorhizobium shangrilense]